MVSNSKKIFACISFILIALSATAQQKELTDTQYFKNDFTGIINPLPSITKWIDDSHVLLSDNGKADVLNCKTGKQTEASKADTTVDTLNAPAYLKGNDIFIKINGQEIKLSNDGGKKANPTMSPDGKFVAYTNKNDLYTIDIQTKKQKRLTVDGSSVILNGYASWVYTEEILGRPSKYRSFWWSPDSRHIAFFRTDDSPVPEYTITDGVGTHGYVEKERYPVAGDPNPEVKIGIVSPEGGNTVWADFNEKDDQYFGMPYWTPDASALWVQWINRGQNDLKIFSVNPANGSKKQVYEEQQKTWVQLEDGYERLHFLNNNKNAIIESDKTGWNHLYLYDINGKLINPITSGKFTVLGITAIDEKNNTVYFTARGRENTARIDFYSVQLSGENLQRLSFGAYNHSISLSPDASYFISTYSNSSTPTKMALVNNKGKIIKEIADSKAAGFDGVQLAKTEIIRVKSADGIYDLPMKVTWPINMDTSKTYPVLISIYGGPNAGTCWDSWNLNGNQQFYAKEGLIQVTMDHRASGQFGKEGQNYIFRNLGYWEMKDYSVMVKWLILNGNADPKKICINGFSYGGYITCYALTYASDVFTHGIAGGSVTDWSLYDTHYTERYMDKPSDNPDGYKSSSVLTYANKYNGKLLIVHGIIDDNVHIQNSIELISKLQDLKKDFEFMEYSGGRHGWANEKNKWAHFLNLKTQFIYKNLLEKPVPEKMLK